MRRVTEHTPASVTVAAEVRAILAYRRIPQADLAEVLGMSQVAVSRRLRGETLFDVDEVAKVAAFLGVSVAALYGEKATA